MSLRGRNLLGNIKAANYSEIAQDLISSYYALGYNMSMELHFLHTHLDFFLKTRESSLMNMVKDAIRALPKWKRGRVKNGFQIS
jgi:hypothetical protein